MSFQIAHADTVNVAVASNFRGPAEVLAKHFLNHSGHHVRISAGSSGKLYAQILHGAPFDVFMSADELRPEKLEQNGLGVSGTRFSYALGQLVLWSQRKQFEGADCLAVLKLLNFDHLAIAHPITAPYGAAAKDWMQKLGLWENVRSRLVTGENIGQAFHFTASGNAALGLIAASQLINKDIPHGSCRYVVPVAEHRPIRQQAVLIERARNNNAARAFLVFLRSEQSAEIIQRYGYRLP
ncbi:MAG: molybdate ABC transporter substrate-binding protein [Gammaproteobacteria bacterium]|nr:molybdate ABC transporter substrate-binding protein [Gammaproteobacteria bacterium]